MAVPHRTRASAAPARRPPPRRAHVPGAPSAAPPSAAAPSARPAPQRKDLFEAILDFFAKSKITSLDELSLKLVEIDNSADLGADAKMQQKKALVLPAVNALRAQLERRTAMAVRNEQLMLQCKKAYEEQRREMDTYLEPVVKQSAAELRKILAAKEAAVRAELARLSQLQVAANRLHLESQFVNKAVFELNSLVKSAGLHDRGESERIVRKLMEDQNELRKVAGEAEGAIALLKRIKNGEYPNDKLAADIDTYMNGIMLLSAGGESDPRVLSYKDSHVYLYQLRNGIEGLSDLDSRAAFATVMSVSTALLPSIYVWLTQGTGAVLKKVATPAFIAAAMTNVSFAARRYFNLNTYDLPRVHGARVFHRSEWYTTWAQMYAQIAQTAVLTAVFPSSYGPGGGGGPIADYMSLDAEFNICLGLAMWEGLLGRNYQANPTLWQRGYMKALSTIATIVPHWLYYTLWLGLDHGLTVLLLLCKLACSNRNTYGAASNAVGRGDGRSPSWMWLTASTTVPLLWALFGTTDQRAVEAVRVYAEAFTPEQISSQIYILSTLAKLAIGGAVVFASLRATRQLSAYDPRRLLNWFRGAPAPQAQPQPQQQPAAEPQPQPAAQPEPQPQPAAQPEPQPQQQPEPQPQPAAQPEPAVAAAAAAAAAAVDTKPKVPGTDSANIPYAEAAELLVKSAHSDSANTRLFLQMIMRYLYAQAEAVGDEAMMAALGSAFSRGELAKDSVPEPRLVADVAKYLKLKAELNRVLAANAKRVNSNIRIMRNLPRGKVTRGHLATIRRQRQELASQRERFQAQLTKMKEEIDARDDNHLREQQNENELSRAADRVKQLWYNRLHGDPRV